MSCNSHPRAASCSCSLLVVLPVLWFGFRTAALAVDILWTAVLWAGHHLFGTPQQPAGSQAAAKLASRVPRRLRAIDPATVATRRFGPRS